MELVHGLQLIEVKILKINRPHMYLTRVVPYVDEENRLVILTNVQSGLPFDVPRCWCPPGYEALTKCCSSLDPNERPSFSGNAEKN